MLEEENSIITKKYAMTIESKYWRAQMLAKTNNIVSEFQLYGFWNLCFTVIKICLKFLRVTVSWHLLRIRPDELMPKKMRRITHDNFI